MTEERFTAICNHNSGSNIPTISTHPARPATFSANVLIKNEEIIKFILVVANFRPTSPWGMQPVKLRFSASVASRRRFSNPFSNRFRGASSCAGWNLLPFSGNLFHSFGFSNIISRTKARKKIAAFTITAPNEKTSKDWCQQGQRECFVSILEYTHVRIHKFN